jgi:gas vesicle protein
MEAVAKRTAVEAFGMMYGRRIVTLTMALGVLGAAPVVAQQGAAQDTTKHEPGGLNKVARDVSKTVKKAGRDTKAETKRVTTRTHRTLKKAGEDTKEEVKRHTATGEVADTTAHEPGGVNKVARDVSKTFKKAGSDTKKQIKRSSSHAHRTLKKAGKDTKESLKDTTSATNPYNGTKTP